MAKLTLLNVVDRAAQGAVLVVRDLTQPVGDDGDHPALLAADGTPATLTLLGADSPQAKRLGYQRAASAQNRLYASAFGGKKRTAVVTPEDVAQQEEDDVAFLVALTVDWHGFEDDDDQPLPCTPEAARALYAQSPMIREQALAFINDRTRFFANSSTRSAPSSSTSSA